MINSSGTQVSKQLFYAYGEVRWSTGTMPTTIGYIGQRRDSGLGSLMFYSARYYSPLLSRFISADTIVPGAGNPQAFNRYSYTLSNPLKYRDPSGHGVDCGIGMGGPCPPNRRGQRIPKSSGSIKPEPWKLDANYDINSGTIAPWGEPVGGGTKESRL